MTNFGLLLLDQLLYLTSLGVADAHEVVLLAKLVQRLEHPLRALLQRQVGYLGIGQGGEGLEMGQECLLAPVALRLSDRPMVQRKERTWKTVPCTGSARLSSARC